MPSADDPHSANDSAAAAVIFSRSAARQAQIWWQTLREAIQSTHTSFAERWSELKARLQPSIRNTRWPTRGQRLGQHLRVMPKVWRNSWAVKFRAKYLPVSIALGLVVLFGFALYSIATLPIGGGLQVEATQSALTFEGAQGEIFAPRGVYKGE